jgi:outer membrane receptor for ferrienterochelin and colicin
MSFRPRETRLWVRPRVTRPWAAALLLAAALSAPRPALADKRADARRHFKAGMALIARGQPANGVAELERAYELLPHPDVLYNIGRAWEAAGNLPLSLQAYRSYLATDPDDAAAVRATVEAMQAELDRAKNPPAPPAPAAPEAPPPAPPPAPVKPPPPAPRGDEALQESVETASRRAQSPLDAPNATSIVTADEIRLSGLTKVQEILRRLPGVDVNVLTGGDAELGVRGFNSRLSNKVLVLLDGRPLYVDTLGVTVWEFAPVDVEQIERIEVVRGPGAALYGANAFGGVINIITRQPGEGRGGARVGAGLRGEIFGSATASQRAGPSAYRVSAGYTREPHWSREIGGGRVDAESYGPTGRSSLEVLRFDAHSTHRLGRDLRLSAGGNFVRASRTQLGAGVFNEYDIVGSIGSVDAALASRHASLRAFYNRNDVAAGQAQNYLGIGLNRTRILIDVADVQPEAYGELKTGALAHQLRGGVNYRYKRVAWGDLNGPQTEHWVGAFAQDETTLGPNVRLSLGARADYVPAVNRVAASPRGSLIVKPTPRSALRATGATAFRSPSFLESYLDSSAAAPGATGAQARGIAARYDNSSAPANYERLLAADVGYLGQDLDALHVELTAFYQRASGLIILSDRRPETPSSDAANGLDPNTGRYNVGASRLDNGCIVYHLAGVEAGARFFPIEGVDLFVNYTFTEPRYQKPASCTDVVDQHTSRHKANAGVAVRTRFGVDGEVTAHYSSSQTWSDGNAGIDVRNGAQPAASPVDAYALVNARLGYRFAGDHAEVSAVGYNLLDHRHRQHPLGQVLARQLMAFVAYRF